MRRSACHIHILEALDSPEQYQGRENWSHGSPRRLASWLIVSQRLIERGILVELGLNAVKGGKRGLRIKINREHAMTRKGKMLGEMRRGGGFAAAALEIHDSDHLQAFARPFDVERIF